MYQPSQQPYEEYGGHRPEYEGEEDDELYDSSDLDSSDIDDDGYISSEDLEEEPEPHVPKYTREELEKKVNEFRNGVILQVQIMCKWEGKEKIDEKLEQIKEIWGEICECIQIEPEIVPFSVEGIKEWTSQWYQNIHAVRKKIADYYSRRELYSSTPASSSNAQNVTHNKEKTTSFVYHPANIQNPTVTIEQQRPRSPIPKSPMTMSNAYSMNTPQIQQSGHRMLFEESKRNVDRLRERCVQLSMDLTRQRAERDRILMELDFVEIRNNSHHEEEFLQQSLSLLEMLKAKYIQECEGLNYSYSVCIEETKRLSGHLPQILHYPEPISSHQHTPDHEPNTTTQPQKSIEEIQRQQRGNKQHIPDTNTSTEVKSRDKTNKRIGVLQEELPKKEYKVSVENGHKLAKQRAMELQRKKKEEEELKQQKELEKQRNLELLKEKQRKQLERERQQSKSREIVQQIIQEEELEEEKEEETNQQNQEKVLLDKLKIDESRKKAAQRAAEAKRKEEDRRRKEQEEVENKRRLHFQKRDERIRKFAEEQSRKQKAVKQEIILEQLPNNYNAAKADQIEPRSISSMRGAVSDASANPQTTSVTKKRPVTNKTEQKNDSQSRDNSASVVQYYLSTEPKHSSKHAMSPYPSIGYSSNIQSPSPVRKKQEATLLLSPYPQGVGTPNQYQESQSGFTSPNSPPRTIASIFPRSLQQANLYPFHEAQESNEGDDTEETQNHINLSVIEGLENFEDVLYTPSANNQAKKATRAATNRFGFRVK